MKLQDELEHFQPWNEQEEKDLEELKFWLNSGKPVFERSSTAAHFTASAWIISKDHTKVLMAYHNLYHSWAWLGGHADGEEDLCSVAEKEAREESGIKTLRKAAPGIFSVEVLCVDGHEKKGQYVSSHLHLNVTYLFEADEEEPLRVKPDENSQVGWIETDRIAEYCSEPWFVERIYGKLVEKTQQKEGRLQ